VRLTTAKLLSLVLGAIVAAGTIAFAFFLGMGIGDCLRGRGLCRVGPELASGDPTVRAVLVLLFLAVVPTAAIAGLLRTLDGSARLIIACTANITILALTAMIMLAAGVWSPRGGLLAVAAITAACLVAQLPPVRRGIRARAASTRKLPASDDNEPSVAAVAPNAPTQDLSMIGDPQVQATVGEATGEG
jgi:hypothetical protein